MKDFMVCIGKHRDFYEEHLGKSRVYPTRVVRPNRFCSMELRHGNRLNSIRTNIARWINVPLICGDPGLAQRERKVIGDMFSNRDSSSESMGEKFKKRGKKRGGENKRRVNLESLLGNS